jgi:hypothetical protein
MESIKTDSKNYIGQIKELLRAPDFVERESKVLLSVTTPSAISFYTFQNLQYQLLQNTVLLVGIFVAIGIYFAVESALDEHHTKKIAAERAETILRLHESIREVYLNKKRH